MARNKKLRNGKLKVQFNEMENPEEEQPCDAIQGGEQTSQVGEASGKTGDVAPAEQANCVQANSAQETVTTTESSKKTCGAARGVAAMYKVVIKKAQGKKFKIRCNSLGIPIGETRHTLQSYIGMLARTMIPINIENWPKVEDELKDKLWLDIEDTFDIPPELRKHVLKSAGIKWRQFKADLTAKHVIPFIGQKKKLRKPPKAYAFVGKDPWKDFVAERISEKWLKIREEASQRVTKRKYPHRTSRKGYIGLQEEEVKLGKLEPDEVPDRAVLWKKARISKDNKIDEEVEIINNRIDSLMEKKLKGEFVPCGSDDVLSRALETPEHSGRVRGVGTFVTPKIFFDLPKEKRHRMTKSELMARDRINAEKLENMKSEIAELRAMIKSSSVTSPMLSDKASCQQTHLHHETGKVKPSAVKDLNNMLEEADCEEDDCVAVDPPPPQDKEKGPRACELAVENIQNIVAFGLVFDEETDMNNTVHGVPMQPGCVRVSVDGCIQKDALVPVPVPGEIERVHQAVGSHVAWPRDLISFTHVISKKKNGQAARTELHKLQDLIKEVEIKKTVPSCYRMLYKIATVMKSTGKSIQILCDAEVFGKEKLIHILHENLIALLEFEMIGQAAICAYMAYLHTVVLENDTTDLYAFCDPGATFNPNGDFEAYIINRLNEGDPERLFILPHNTDFHWILILIWGGDIYICNPMPHSTTYPKLENALTSAVRTFHSQKGRAKKDVKVTHLCGCPKQPGGFECGYVVMRYMKEIVEDPQLSILKKWMGRTRKCCSTEDLNAVRFETLDHIQVYM